MAEEQFQPRKALMPLSPARKAILALTAAFCVFFLPALFTSAVPYYRDTLVTVLPMRHYLHERLLEGQLPQWYPREALGVPFIGQIATATFHPQTVLFLWLTPVYAVKWNLLLMYALALAGAYKFARALGHPRDAAVAAAIAFGFGGYALGVSSNLVYAGAHALLPWVGAFAVLCRTKSELQHAVGLAVAWALLFLQGDAQAFMVAPLLIIACAVATRSVARSSIAGCCAAFFLSLLLIAPELWPATVIGNESVRSIGERSATVGLTWAFHPLRALELVCAGFVPDAVRNEFTTTFFGGGRAVWATTVFFGVIPIVLFAVGIVSERRRYWPFAIVALLAVWLALGDRGVLLAQLSRFMPLIDKFRYPEKYLSLLWVCAVPLVAAGYVAVQQLRRAWIIAAVSAGALCVVAVMLGRPQVVAMLRGSAQVSAEFDAVVGGAWQRGFLFAAIAAAGLAFALTTRGRELRFPLVTLLLFAELYVGNASHLPLVPAELITSPALLAQHVSGTDSRVIREVAVTAPSTVSLGDGELWVKSVRSSFHPNSGELDRVSTFEPNLPAVPWRYAMLLAGAKSPPRPELFRGCIAVTTSSTSGLAHDAEAGLSLISRRCEPRAFIAPSTQTRSAGFSLQELRASPGRIFVEDGDDTTSSGEVKITAESPETLELETATSDRAALYVSDGHSAGWTATVDGEPAHIHPANVAARVIYVPGGSHKVRFEYRTPHLKEGLIAGLVGWLIVAAVISLRLLRPGRFRIL